MFEKIKGLFSDKKNIPPLYSSNHIAAKEIAKAEKIAVGISSSQITGVIKTRSFNTDDYLKLKEVLDCAILKCPDDPNLFYARACAHYYALQGEDGMKDRDHCLSLMPDHFDANMKKENFSSWEGVFELSGFSEDSTSIPNSILKGIESGQLTQVIRDHLSGAIVLFIPRSQLNMDGYNKMRWELRWESTPHGKIAAHYIFLDNGKFHEQFIPHLANDDVTIKDNYWILRRFANVSYCIIAIIDGDSIVHNEKFIFPHKLVTTLKLMEKDLIKDGPAVSIEDVQQAAQWYMKNSNENSLKY